MTCSVLSFYQRSAFVSFFLNKTKYLFMIIVKKQCKRALLDKTYISIPLCTFRHIV